MEKALIILIKILVLGIAIIGFSYFFSRELYSVIIKEDGIIENLTALTLLTISILFLYRLIKSRGRSRSWVIFNLLIILGSFFGFGEEVSWGQRIFSVETSDFFSQYNLQNETNLHNLKIGGVKINKFIFTNGLVIVFGSYFVLSLVFYKRSQFVKRIVDKFGVPIPKLQQSLLMVFVTLLIMIIPDGKKWELWEAVFCLLILLIFLDPYNVSEKLLPARNKIAQDEFVA